MTRDKRQYLINDDDHSPVSNHARCCKCGKYIDGCVVYARHTWRTPAMPASAYYYHCNACALDGATMTLQDQQWYASHLAGRSHGLWRSVNMVIATVIARGIKHRHPRGRIADRLGRIAGPKTKNEPMCLINYREAARAVREADMMYLT